MNTAGFTESPPDEWRCSRTKWTGNTDVAHVMQSINQLTNQSINQSINQPIYALQIIKQHATTLTAPGYEKYVIDAYHMPVYGMSFITNMTKN